MLSWTEPADVEPSIQLAAMGSFHIGGHWQELHNAPPRTTRFTNGSEPEMMSVNGQYWVNSMYVQYYVPSRTRGASPLLLWHGGGLTGAFFETTPDGREGWLNYFLRAGWPVFNCDAVERGRAGWMPYEELQTSKPLLNARHSAFERFRIGQGVGSFDIEPGERIAHANTQFPLAAYDQFVRQQVPRWTDSAPATLSAYCELLNKVASSVIVAHSQGGQYALQAAMVRPDLIKALVLVEPSGICEPDEQQLLAMARIPCLVIHGDHISEDSRWVAIRRRTNTLFERLRAAGADVEMLELPEVGQLGNSHLIPIDHNNFWVAQYINQWLAQHGLHHDDQPSVAGM